MNKRIKKIIAIAISISMWMPYATKAATQTANSAAVLTAGSSQSEDKFPQDNPTSRVYAKSRTSFKAYKGRGTVIIENHGAKSADVFVNGNQINISDALKTADGKQTIDIGKYTQDGENLLKVVNVKPDGSYMNVKVPYPELIEAKPEDAGFSSSKLSAVDDLINDDIKNGFPGAALIIIKDGKIIKNTAYGYAKKYENSKLLPESQWEKVTTNTLFDLASNSKMYATNFALQKLVSEGKVKIDDFVSKYIPDFKDGDGDTIKGKANIKIRDLLDHCAGFTPDPQYFKPDVAKDLYSQDRATTLKMLEKTPLTYVTGSKVLYSDVDYMLLGYIIEKITGETEDVYVSENIYKPLGLNRITYNPLKNGFNKSDCAATELNGNTRDGVIDFPNVRKYTLQGEVHDEKAFYSMGGVSGHAGLFSDTHDLAVLAQVMLNGGGYGGTKLFDKAIVDQFTKTSDISENYGLGWDKAGYNGSLVWEFGPYASASTFGHTGWTGTVTAIDPGNDMAVILLTNKKHSPLVDPKKNANGFAGDTFETGRYGSVMSLVYEALMEKTQNNRSSSNTVTDEKNMNASQIDEKFPEDDATSRIYARYRRQFKGYEGKGTMSIENHGATSAEVYVNGVKVDTSQALKANDGKQVIDIGRYTVNGENTLKVLNVAPDKAYINVKVAYPELTYGTPEETGFSSSRLSKVDTLINSEVNAGFPGAVLLVVKDGKIIKNTAYGYAKEYENSKLLPEYQRQRMTANTLFDLASNSKMYATNFALQKLVSEGKINIDDPVNKYIPDFKDGDNDAIKGKANIKIRNLLDHCAGFSADIHYFNPSEAKDLYSQDRETTLKMLAKTPLSYVTGSKVLYSDVDYMLLGYIIEKITGETEDKYVSENIYEPLGLNRTTYNPLKKGFSKSDCAATELNGNTRDGSVNFQNVRTYTLQGEVHDEKAFYSMGGVSGHAGLFSDTHDLAVLAQVMLNGGGYGNVKLFDKSVTDQFTKTSAVSQNYGLGWDKAGNNGSLVWEFSPYASASTIGHTGWTGTLTAIDPVNDMAVILLTNKKHSPVINPAVNKNTFAGDSFETGSYGSIVSLVYEALYENGNSSDTSTIQAAEDKVSIAEKTLTQLDLNKASALMSIVPGGDAKNALSARIKAVQDKINLQDKVSDAYDAVAKAESSMLPQDIKTARKLVSLLSDGNDKSALTARLNAVEQRKIKLGIDNIDSVSSVFKDKKVGLITNPSGMNSSFTSSIDVLKSKTNLVALFAAEHGIRGNSQDGGTIGNEVDVKTGLPVYSLYGSVKKPTTEMLKNVDVLAYDIQDVGARFYTFINTMAYGMQACAENNKTFVVFDRPNPVGGTIQGTILNMDFKSFVGMYPIPQRYGMTVGEFAKYINKEFNINCNLVVVPMTGWNRDMYYDETGSKTWVMPSPNMPTLDTAIVYTGTCAFEGTNVSEGRGTTRPFELIGAPWINSLDLADKLNSLNLPGVRFRATSFTPTFSKYSSSDKTYNTTGKAQLCGGVQVYVIDRKAFNSVKTGLAMLYSIKEMYPKNFQYNSDNYIDLLTGDSYIREGKYTLPQLFEKIDKESEQFKAVSQKYYIY